MEQYIIYIIIAISVVANIYKNYKKQQEKDSKRVVEKPVANTQPPLQKETLFVPKPQKPKQTTTEATKKEVYNSRRSTIEASIDQGTSKQQYISKEYESLESIIDEIEGNHSVFETVDDSENESIEKNDITNNKQEEKKAHPLFETKDDLTKSILYGAILERRY